MWPGYGDHMGLMWLWSVLGIAILAMFVWAIARMAGPARLPPADESPETILKRRYARGEIDANEYERRLNDLRK